MSLSRPYRSDNAICTRTARRISSNNSTFDLLDTGPLRSNFKLGTDSPGQLPGVGQIKRSKVGQFRVAKSGGKSLNVSDEGDQGGGGEQADTGD